MPSKILLAVTAVKDKYGLGYGVIRTSTGEFLKGGTYYFEKDDELGRVKAQLMAGAYAMGVRNAEAGEA